MAVIWRDIDSAPCIADLPPDVRASLDLLRAICRRDHQRVAALAAGRLDAAGNHRSIVLLAAMAAHLALDDPGSAMGLWKRYRRHVTPDIRLHLMAAWADAQKTDRLDASYAAHSERR